jgi:hypothetical protein
MDDSLLMRDERRETVVLLRLISYWYEMYRDSLVEIGQISEVPTVALY